MSPSKNKEFTYQLATDRENKNLTILELIRKKGPISRTDIAKVTDINAVSVSNYVNNFLKKDLVIEGGLDISSGGRRPELLELNKKAGFVVGVELGEDRMRAVLTNLGLEVAAKKQKDTGLRKVETVVDEAAGLVKDLVDRSERKEFIRAVGVGFSGIIDEKRNELYYDIDLFSAVRDAMESKLKISTFFGEDCVCAAFAEKNLNPKLQQDKVLFIYSDLGACVFIEKDAFSVPQEASEKDAPFYYLRPWRPDLGILSRARRAVEKGVGTRIVEFSGGSVENISIDTVIEAARNEDGLSAELIESAALNLGVRVAYLINLFNPDSVAVGGGIEKAGGLFLNPLKKSIERLAHNNLLKRLQIVPGISGEDQVVVGAAGLTIRELFIGV